MTQTSNRPLKSELRINYILNKEVLPRSSYLAWQHLPVSLASKWALCLVFINGMWKKMVCVISKPQLLGNRCDFFMLSFPVCWLRIEASENIGNTRATRSKVCGSLHYYMEEGCVPARNNYIGLLHVHKINFSCVKPLSFLWQLMLPSLMQVKKSCCLSFLEASPNLVD